MADVLSRREKAVEDLYGAESALGWLVTVSDRLISLILSKEERDAIRSESHAPSWLRDMVTAWDDDWPDDGDEGWWEWVGDAIVDAGDKLAVAVPWVVTLPPQTQKQWALQANAAVKQLSDLTVRLFRRLYDAWQNSGFDRLRNHSSRLVGRICRAQQAVRRVVDDLRNQQFALTATAQGGKPAGEINANSGATHPATADGGAGHDDESAAAKKAILKQMESAVRKAYWSYQYAVTKVEKKELEDREAYQLLEDEGIPADKGDLGELKGYELPLFDTWSRQLRNARKALGEQKYTARSGRDTGRSIVSGDRIEYQNPKGH